MPPRRRLERLPRPARDRPEDRRVRPRPETGSGSKNQPRRPQPRGGRAQAAGEGIGAINAFFPWSPIAAGRPGAARWNRWTGSPRTRCRPGQSRSPAPGSVPGHGAGSREPPRSSILRHEPRPPASLVVSPMNSSLEARSAAGLTKKMPDSVARLSSLLDPMPTGRVPSGRPLRNIPLNASVPAHVYRPRRTQERWHAISALLGTLPTPLEPSSGAI